MSPFILSMAVSESLRDCSSSFVLSSALSSSASQYSFLSSSASCSLRRFVIIPSIMSMTLPKPTALPFNANAIRSRPGDLRLWAACRSKRNAFAFWLAMVTFNCRKLEAELGKVFLKRSSASSSLSTLTVSARASSSSARIFFTSSHSSFFVAQPWSSSARYFSSAARASLVSSISLMASVTSTPMLPRRVDLSSICACNVSTSLPFAAMSSS
mmetsp:Transcript_73492/g.212871  ORF Transcript_73492/g.212871 Transcript_73492/m.212871 type:complete len:213 (-) Transcript_73492:88-726(-)